VNLVDGLHTRNSTKKPLAIVLRRVGKGSRGRDSRSDLTNVQYKPIWNYHNESPLYNKNILIKITGEKRLVRGSFVMKEEFCLMNMLVFVQICTFLNLPKAMDKHKHTYTMRIQET
jgi:hypothetical protein